MLVILLSLHLDVVYHSVDVTSVSPPSRDCVLLASVSVDPSLF